MQITPASRLALISRVAGSFCCILGVLAILLVPHALYWPGSLWKLGIYTDQVGKLSIGLVGLSLLLLGIQLLVFAKSRHIVRHTFTGIGFFAVVGLLALVVPTVANSRISVTLDVSAELVDIPLQHADTGKSRFLIIGDTGHRAHRLPPVMDRIAALHDSHPFEAAFLLGDMLDGGEEDFNTAMVRQFIDPYAPLLDRNIRHFLTLGNHEVYDGYADGAIQHPFFNMGGQPYYARTFADGEITVFFLDSTRLVEHPAQLIWFQTMVEQTTSTWKILCIHHTLVGSDINHGPDERRYDFLAPIIHGENGIDLVLSGHNHFYERMNVIDGTLFVTAGHGSNPTNQTGERHPESAFKMIDRLGFLVMTHDGDTLEFESITREGDMVDRFAIIKQGNSIAAVP